MRVVRSELQALARKYRALAELRRSTQSPEPALLRALAREFPGALRELDCLPLDVLDARLNAVLDAANGAAPQDWVGWMLAYHQRMRLVLAVKRRLAARPAPQTPIEVIEAVWLELHERCTVELVRSVARPPAGRLNRLVFEVLEGELGRPRDELEGTLFPGLAPSRLRRAAGGSF